MVSRIRILDIGYGVLNPSFNSYAKNNYDTEEAGFFDLVKRTVDNEMGFNEFEGQGPLIGICLRDEGETNTNGMIGPTEWFSLTKAAAQQSGVDTPALVQIKVRVPELHAALPVPSDLPNRILNQQHPDHAIINMYPTFTAQTADMGPPEPGTLVWIDFQNRETLEGGIFVKPVDRNAVAPSTLPLPSAAASHRAGARRAVEIEAETTPLPPLPPPPPPPPLLLSDWTSLDLSSQSGPGYYVKHTTWTRISGGPGRQAAASSREFTSPLWGQTDVIATILEICGQFAVYSSPGFGAAGRLVLGDISGRYGGKIMGHGTHQTGADIDIGIPVNTLYGFGSLATNWANAAGNERGATGGAGQQIARTHVVVREAEILLNVLRPFCDPATTPPGLVPIEKILISTGVARKLFVTAGGEAHHLDPIIYPARASGLGGRSDSRFNGKVRYEVNHDDHIHVRFETPWGKTTAPGGAAIPPKSDPFWG